MISLVAESPSAHKQRLSTGALGKPLAATLSHFLLLSTLHAHSSASLRNCVHGSEDILHCVRLGKILFRSFGLPLANILDHDFCMALKDNFLFIKWDGMIGVNAKVR